eukprot:SAG11_NODE_789_length_7139_cov_5.205607_4_plen_123_part_00
MSYIMLSSMNKMRYNHVDIITLSYREVSSPLENIRLEIHHRESREEIIGALAAADHIKIFNVSSVRREQAKSNIDVLRCTSCFDETHNYATLLATPPMIVFFTIATMLCWGACTTSPRDALQ